MTWQNSWNCHTKFHIAAPDPSHFWPWELEKIGSMCLEKKLLWATICNYCRLSAQMLFPFFGGGMVLDREDGEEVAIFGWKINVTKWIIGSNTHLSYRFSYPCTWQGLITASRLCNRFCRLTEIHSQNFLLWERGLSLLKHMHVTNMHLQRNIYTHTYSLICALQSLWSLWKATRGWSHNKGS